MTSAMDIQQGGDHYKNIPIQPAEYNQRNRVGWCEGEAIKYATRHKDKGGAGDLKKAVHCLHIALEIEYGIVGTAGYDDFDSKSAGMPAGKGHAPGYKNPCLPPDTETVLTVDHTKCQIMQLPDIYKGGGFEVQAAANSELGIGWVGVKNFLHKDHTSCEATLRAARAFAHEMTGTLQPFDVVWVADAAPIISFKPPCPTEPCPGCESCNGPGAKAVSPLAAVTKCDHAWHKVPSIVPGDTCPNCGVTKAVRPGRCPHLWHVSPADLRPPNCPDCGSEVP